MRYEKIVSFVCFLQLSFAIDIEFGSRNTRESRKLFGGYRITPKFCKPTRKTAQDLHGPSICMFNHECSQRSGQVVGACMDGFLFGACCQLPAGSTGELIESDINPITSLDNDLSHSITSTTEGLSTADIMSNGVSQIAQSLLNPDILPTAQDNEMVQINERPQFSTSSITHSAPETQILNESDHSDKINTNKLQPMGMEDRKTTVQIEYSTVPYSEISISNGPSIYTTLSGYHRPSFRPKPSKPSDADKYVLVPTITVASKPNKTQETNSQPVVNIYQLINGTATSRRPPSTSYVFGATSTRRPTEETKSTSRKPPSTSYVFSTTLKPRRTTTGLTTTTKRNSKPTKNSNRKTTTEKPNYFTLRPGHSTVANSPSAFSTKPPSTSYVYSAMPTRRPPSTVDTHIAGPQFSVTSPTYSTYSSPAPTLIVLGPADEQEQSTEPNYASYQSTRPQYPYRPNSSPSRKPINSVTINNHVTQNIYSTSERPPFPPQPTVLITPKPSISSSIMPNIDYNTAAVEVETSGDELINFPPVRNPNLNMSNPTINDDDITTPGFVEDDALNDKVESFVNKIIQGLQEPFQGLKDVVYNQNKTTASTTTTKKPVKKTGTTTKRPTTTRITTRPTTTRRTTTRRTTTQTTPRRTTTTTKRTRTTRRPTTTTESYIEHDDNGTSSDAELYRNGKPQRKPSKIKRRH